MFVTTFWSTLKPSVGDMADWKVATNKAIANNLLESVASLLNGRWYTVKTSDHTGKQTTKHIIEFDTPNESDSANPDVSGSDPSDA